MSVKPGASSESNFERAALTDSARAILRARLRANLRQEYWKYIGVIASGRGYRSSERVDTGLLEPGRVLRATDRFYEVQANGSWRKRGQDRENQRPREQSEIYLPHWPSRNKYAPK